MGKTRIDIPRDTAASIQFRSDRTCCVCRERGLPTQIHHIDENPSNNDENNLSLLCLHCHDLTQIKGGFGRKLDNLQVIKYRDDWHARVQKRRDIADEIAAAHQAAPLERVLADPVRREELPSPDKLTNYIRTLSAIRRDAYNRARPLWDTGVTPKQKQGCYDVSDVLEQILTTLASWYPQYHFDGREPQDYINAMTASRFTWHKAHLEPNGMGTGGTMIGPMVAGCVMNDLEEMIVDTVSSLSMHLGYLDYDQWHLDWQAADESQKMGSHRAR